MKLFNIELKAFDEAARMQIDKEKLWLKLNFY